jgi:hypothetical protein
MRSLLTITAVLLLGITACNKGEPVTPGLFGKWELRRQSGGLLGLDTTYKVGNGTMYQFKSDSTYLYYVKHQLTSRGTFRIKALNVPGINSVTRIYFDHDTAYGEPFVYTGTTIIIGTSAADGIESEYDKIGN